MAIYKHNYLNNHFNLRVRPRRLVAYYSKIVVFQGQGTINHLSLTNLVSTKNYHKTLEALRREIIHG